MAHSYTPTLTISQVWIDPCVDNPRVREGLMILFPELRKIGPIIFFSGDYDLDFDREYVYPAMIVIDSSAKIQPTADEILAGLISYRHLIVTVDEDSSSGEYSYTVTHVTLIRTHERRRFTYVMAKGDARDVEGSQEDIGIHLRVNTEYADDTSLKTTIDQRLSLY
ncbi:MAG: hypothetical protein DI585_04970 [Pseudomonas fluorescens]|nr:MAG: hypothetical protein DI585_04970 [Pseudomonas fluorescens]